MYSVVTNEASSELRYGLRVTRFLSIQTGVPRLRAVPVKEMGVLTRFLTLESISEPFQNCITVVALFEPSIQVWKSEPCFSDLLARKNSCFDPLEAFSGETVRKILSVLGGLRPFFRSILSEFRSRPSYSKTRAF